MGITLNYIETESRKVYYRINGAENSRTIIFIHGIAADSRFFHNQLKFFGTGMRVIAIDLPGHGRSLNSESVSAEIYNNSIEQVIRKENIGKYIIAGHSMGGPICLEHYRRNRDRIEALILISTAARIPVSEEMINRSVNSFDTFFNEMLESIFFKKAGIFILAAKKGIVEKEKSIITEDMKICMNLDCTDILPSIERPVLLLTNRYDCMIPSVLTEKMKEKIKNSRLVIFEKKGHIPFFEESEEFNSTVAEFISSIQ